MGTHLRVLNESYPINTNMTGFKNLCILVLWTKVTSALEGLSDAQETKMCSAYIDHVSPDSLASLMLNRTRVSLRNQPAS